MKGRRAFLLVSGASLFTPHVASSLAGESDDWREEYKRSWSQASPQTLGRKIPPLEDPVWDEVEQILSNAPPPGAIPIDIASYFVDSVPSKFQGAWPEADAAHPTYANPLILRFFLSTRTQPLGDETAWCAAFVNWCLQRAHIPGTNSASSQSFLTWGNPVWSSAQGGIPQSARRGDIAVFRKVSDPEHGHVAFFSAIDHMRALRIEVTGGNQMRGRGPSRRHVIDTDSLRIDSPLELISIRTSIGMRSS